MNEPEAGDVIQDADWAGTMRSLEQISERFPGDFKDATKQSRTGVWNLLTEHQGKHSTLRSVRKVVGIGIGSPTRVKDPAFERTMARLEVFFGLAEEMSRKTEFEHISTYIAQPAQDEKDKKFFDEHIANGKVVSEQEAWGLVDEETLLFIPTLPVERAPDGRLIKRPGKETVLDPPSPCAVICTNLVDWVNRWNGNYWSPIAQECLGFSLHQWAFRGNVLYISKKKYTNKSDASRPPPEASQAFQNLDFSKLTEPHADK